MRKPSFRRVTKEKNVVAPIETVQFGELAAALVSAIHSALRADPSATVPPAATGVVDAQTNGVLPPPVPLTRSEVAPSSPNVVVDLTSRSIENKGLHVRKAPAPVTKRPRLASSASSGDDGNTHARWGSSSSTSVGSGGNPQYYWDFSHRLDTPIVNDPRGVSTLHRHYKFVGCQLPVVKNMREPDLYVDMSMAFANAIAYSNQMVYVFEHHLGNVPRRDELEEAKRVVRELTLTIHGLREQETKNAAKVARLAELGIAEANLCKKLHVATNEIADLEKANAVLTQKFNDLSLSVQNRNLTSAHGALVRPAVRAVQRALSESYHRTLLLIKE